MHRKERAMKTLLLGLLSAAAVSVGAAGSTAATFPTCLGEPATKIGTPGDDTITATDDDDVIVGLGGNDTISGLGGPDLIGAEAGDDVVDGGKGRDQMYYGDSPSGVHVRLAKGTATGEGNDHLKSIEDVTGSKRADVIVGTSGPNT